MISHGTIIIIIFFPSSAWPTLPIAVAFHAKFKLKKKNGKRLKTRIIKFSCKGNRKSIGLLFSYLSKQKGSLFPVV